MAVLEKIEAEQGTKKEGGLGIKLDRQLDRVRGASNSVKSKASRAAASVREAPPPSPNPMTNLLIADIALRGGGRILRHLVEANVLKSKYSPDKARSIIKGRGMAQTLIGTAIARVATRSIPGALIVGGGLLVKALIDRKMGEESRQKGEQAVDRRAAKGK